ncbi:hypothetical protein DCAR_0522256 [Daucus carota subsp. sativus]|uniref:Chlorophyll a-b binding protein, chloroplastic n=1 Tax=Daucus carota subsp. sativus TaxID=79200 RepID=A0AAF0XAR3_DAUCS|nr:hypothetical protein DCAR_0522256 [Daucus carota subsp. sativus]
MDTATSRGFQVLACSGTSSFTRKKIHKTSFCATYLPARRGHAPRHLITCIRAQERPTWLPGLDSPPYLDGTLPGDYGFDPLGLGEDPESLRWYVQAELVHARFAMAGVAGILLTDLLRVTGVSDLPVWYEAGTTKFSFASTTTLFIVLHNVGRLAMVAMLGFIVQASVTHVGPVNNLMEHLSNPWHRTIIQTLAESGP